MKKFTEADVKLWMRDGGCIFIGDKEKELVDAQPWWMKRGLQQTTSGYGAKLHTGRKIHFCGRLYTIYATCYSNSASCWFTVKGRKIYVN